MRQSVCATPCCATGGTWTGLPLLEENKKHPTTQHIRKCSKLTVPKICSGVLRLRVLFVPLEEGAKHTPENAVHPNWAAANGGVTNGGLRSVWPPFLEIGRNRPFSPFFWEIQKMEEKGLFPQISSDLLKPPSLKPPFAAPQPKSQIMGTVDFLRFAGVSRFQVLSWPLPILKQ